jgi:seryl-tRNA synthetase
MLLINYIRDNKAHVVKQLAIKNFDATILVDEVIELDILRKKTQKELDDILAESNKLAKEIGNLYKQGQRDKAEEAKAKSAELKTTSKELDELLSNTVNSLNNKLVELPNVPHISVPAGNSDADNELIYEDKNLKGQ